MSEEAKTVDPESRRLEVVEEEMEAQEKEPPKLSLKEQQSLMAQKMEELKEAGVDMAGMRAIQSVMGAAPGMASPGMVPGMMPGMTSIGPPSMAAAPPPPMPHMLDPIQEMQVQDQIPDSTRRNWDKGTPQQQHHPSIKRAKPDRPDIQMTDDGLVQLDPMTMLEIELLTAELRAASAEEALATNALRESRERMMALRRKQSMMMGKITSTLGVKPGGSIRLVDKEQRLCRIEE